LRMLIIFPLDRYVVPLSHSIMQNILNTLFRDAPVRVQVALTILWVAIIFNCIYGALAKKVTFPQTSTSMLESVAILLVIYNVGRAILYLKIGEGKRWARNVFYALAAFSLFSLTSISVVTRAHGALSALCTILSIGVDGVAAVLLMQTPKSFWDRA